jgi:hypothetical protein
MSLSFFVLSFLPLVSFWFFLRSVWFGELCQTPSFLSYLSAQTDIAGLKLATFTEKAA